MTERPPIYVSRLVRLALLDAEGVPIGRVDDVVLAPPAAGRAPRVLGFVAAVQRRRIFVNANRVGEIDADGVRLSSGTVDLRRFALRPGELLARRHILDRPSGADVVNDLALQATPARFRTWEVAAVSIGPRGVFRRRRTGRVVSWVEAAGLFDVGPVARQVAEYRELHPADMAQRIAKLPPERRRALAQAMDDERLADLLEELPEEEQVRLIESLDVERAADVLEEMEADDAVDLLAELPAGERDELLRAMEPEEAIPLRRLLEYEGDTAGGLMTPGPLVLGPDTTVAEALARLRDVDLAAALATQVFVAQPPTETPTGSYLGTVGFQRLLRERPASTLGDCIDAGNEPVSPDMPEAEVARRLAAYDAVAVAVCDEGGRLVGAVTVDDVLDRVLPEGWRDR
jgi:CBS domain-containing protein